VGSGRGLEFLAEENFPIYFYLRNNRAIAARLVRDLREKYRLVIDGGYGKIKGQTFRLSNMGDETEETISHLLACLDACLE
jgi:aspartate aminotransferase-like enzyme